MGARPSTRPYVASTTEKPESKEIDNENEDTVETQSYNIMCKKSSTNNGAYNFEECKIVMISGESNDTTVQKPEQRMGGITIHGISPIDRGEARDISQTGVINISPFGRIYFIYPGVTSVMNDTLPKKID